MNRCLSVLTFLTVLGASSVAFGQTPTAAQPAAPALPDARGIAATCGSLPPADRPLPVLTVPQRIEYQRHVLAATSSFSSGQFADALRAQWAAYAVNPVPEAANQLWVTLRRATVEEVSPDQRCALVACVLVRATGAQRTELEAENARCTASSSPTPAQPVETFALTGDVLTAVLANPTLAAEIRRDPHTLNVTMAGHADELRVPVTFRPRINAAVEAYRRTRPSTVVTPNPRPSRSTVGYAVPISLWGAGALALVGGIVSTTSWSANNAFLDAANRGETNTGWPRQAEADAQNAGTRAVLLYTSAALLVAGGTITWFLLAPRQSTPTAAPVRPRAALFPNVGPDQIGAVFTGSF